ncbi:MAG: response regulator [Gammaproteobacteria bacterium]|nr:response regulator [Gammaproteobacteria bacterium]
MAHKCALIVDDSKTARRFLSQILERHQMRIETAGSAEEALEFLSGFRPDVIFMDHMMPGMDGFEAVRAIKNNPDTATIPIMMYTSKAGELYVSQARALGAVGVLPKQIKPVEVDELLQSLHLVPVSETAAVDDELPLGQVEIPEEDLATDAREEMQRALQETDWDDMHRWLEEMLRHHRRGMRSDVEETVTRLLDARFPEPGPAAEQEIGGRGRPSMTTFLVLALAGLAATFFWLHQESQQRWRDVAARNAELASTLEARRLAEAEDAAGIREYLDTERANLLRQYDDFLAALEWGVNQSAEYEPGEIPLGDARLEVLTGLLDRLREVGFSGVVSLQIHSGNFCLMPDQNGEWRPAPDTMPASACARIGGATTDDGFNPELQSVAFANFRADLEGPVQIEVEELGDSMPLIPYPSSSLGASAGEWNRAAASNNRVQVRLLPDTELPIGAWPAADLRQ